MPATNGVAVLEKVRAALAEAEAAGQPRPGRPALVKLTGASEHQVRKALEDLAGSYPASSSSAVTSDGEPSPATPDTEDEPGPDAPAMIDDQPTAEPEPPAPITHLPANPPPGEPTAPAGARLVAWAGFAFGSIISVAANVLYTWLPTSQHPPGWTPGLAPQIGAAVWPIALLISVEALSRVPWKPGVWWGLARYGGAGLVALGSGIISYGHLKGVLTAWGYGSLEAGVGPLVVDGLMVISGFALLAMGKHQPRRAGDEQ